MSYIDHTIGAYLRRNILLPLYWKYIKRLKVLDYYKELQAHQWNTLKKNRNLQRIKLFKLIQYASQNIPYYQRVIQEHQISFSEDTIFTDLKKLPLLTKEIIRNNFDQLYKFRDHTYYRNTSGGSTGEPVIFYQDRYYFDWSIATKILFDEWAGRKIGEPMVKLWGSLRDVLRGGQGFRGYLRQQLSGVTIINSFGMTEKDMYKYVQRINKIKPRLILAFVNSIDELVRFIQEHHLSVYSPPAIMTSGGVLFPEIRARIKGVFHANLFDRYGSREVGDIACNCEKSEDLHLIPDIHYLEIVDDKGKEVNQDERGEIIITLLTNYTMPLIRYKISDRGILSDQDCKCGHGLPLLEKVIGRTKCIFKNKFGVHIDSGLFNQLFFFRENIKQFQVIQETIDYISINLVLIDKTKMEGLDEDYKEINQIIWKVMSDDTKIKYNIVDEIKPSPSGKYMYTFSRLEN
jgi:phenylacetate-CoA ligase